MSTPKAVLCGALALATASVSFSQTPAPAAPAPAEAPKPVTPPPLKDADGRTIRRAPTGHLTNYYEEKVAPYTIPELLMTNDGRPVRDADMWFKVRRPELLRAYENEVFGRVPANAPKVRFEIAEKDVPALDGKAVRKRVVAHFGDAPDGPAANLMLYLPATASGPVPVVLHISFGGDPVLPLPEGTPPRRFNDMGPAADAIARGYAYAIVRYSEIQPDNAEGRTKGVIGLTLAPGATAPAPNEWGTIASWAWGLSRFMDYLETDSAVNAKRVAIVGHSRLGKTVLWAGASDPRIALVYSSQSGEMGAALSRRDFGETVDDMVERYGYQFAGNLAKYSGHWNEMPHEGHFLISLSAPRPVFVSAGSGDLWSDPRGQFLAMVAAGPLWKLLGQSDLGTTEMPALDQPVATGTLAYLEHDGGHVVSPLDWKTFLDFADRFLKPKK